MKTVCQLSCLTPLRGIAALLVILFHYNLFMAVVIDPEKIPLSGKLYLMVGLYFISVYRRFFCAHKIFLAVDCSCARYCELFIDYL